MERRNKMTKFLMAVCICLGVMLPVQFDASAQEMNEFQSVQEFAHRGLYDNVTVPENSLSAFKKAIAKGYGIELDVHLTKDGKLLVSHDWNIKKMTGVDRNIEDMTLAQLQSCKLLNTDETFCTLEDVLKLNNGQVPMMIELKPANDDDSQDKDNEAQLADAVVEAMKSYTGSYALISFNWNTLNEVKKDDSTILRGLLLNSAKDDLYTSNRSGFETYIKNIENIVDPDFISVNYANYTNDQAGEAIIDELDVPAYTWTIKSQSAEDEALKVYDGVVFDSYEPSAYGWKYMGGNWFYKDHDGTYLRSQWIQDDGTWYYVQRNGRMAKSGWYYIDNNWYYFKSNGAMQTGWIYNNDTDSWYFLHSNGRMASNEWLTINGQYYYFKSNGAMQTGWTYDNDNNSWYFLHSDGVMARSEWLTIDGEEYYFKSNGAMQTGWIYDNDTSAWYFLHSNGQMARNGWLTIDGKDYYFYKNGAMAKDTQIDGYYVN